MRAITSSALFSSFLFSRFTVLSFSLLLNALPCPASVRVSFSCRSGPPEPDGWLSVFSFDQI